jgi:hypothetical protein
MDWIEKVGFTLGGIAGIVVWILFFLSIDKIPATPDDYLQLESYAIEIQQNPSLLSEINFTMKNNNDTVVICFENDKCRVNAKYDQRFKLISISREDKSMFWLWALLISLILGIWVYCAGSFLFMFLIALFCVLVNTQLPIKKVKT